MVEGTMNIAALDDLKAKYFGNDMQRFLDELKFMLDGRILEERKVQINLCANLNQYHKGATVMLDMKNIFKLTGDFTDMEKLVHSVR